jgi:hypothetical protein
MRYFMKFSLRKNLRASNGMVQQNIVCENAKVQGLDVQERYVQVQDEFVKEFEFTRK